MNRDVLLEHAERIEGNAHLIRHFLHAEPFTGTGTINLGLEILGRCNIIEAHVQQLRTALAAELAPENLHVIGDRPNGDAA